jgi:hypothetical protein
MKQSGAVMRSLSLWSALAGAVLLVPLVSLGQEPAGKYSVKFHEPKMETTEAFIPIDPTPRIQYSYTGNMCMGLQVDGQKWLCCGQGAIRTSFRIDGQNISPQDNMSRPLDKKDGQGKARPGFQTAWTHGDVHIKMSVELVPTKMSGQGAAGAKRPLDAVLVKYLIENKGNRPHEVGARVRIDTMCGNNDGALFASPTTHPGKILNGVEMKGKELPEFFQILERPDLKDPGLVGHYKLKMGNKLEGPSRIAMTSHGAGEDGWNVQVIQANGDSDSVLYWDPKPLPPNSKREVGYAYGKGLATDPESEGRISLAFGGSFEPNKLFSITAYVDDAVAAQTLALELPAGMERVEGKELQPVPAPREGAGTSVVLWKGRVLRPGEYTLRVRSSNGVTLSRTVTITRQ